MKTLFSVVGFALLYVIFALSSCATQQESGTSSAKPAATAEAKSQPAEKAPAKAEAKAETKSEKNRGSNREYPEGAKTIQPLFQGHSHIM